MKTKLFLLAAALGLALTTACGAQQKPTQDTMDKIKELGSIFSEMVDNKETFGKRWRNIPLGKKAFALLKDELPLRVQGELTPYTRIVLLNNMMDCMPERDCARFCKEVQEYQLTLFALVRSSDIDEDMDIDGYEGAPAAYQHAYTRAEHLKGMQRIKDYLDTDIAMEEWCKRYNVMLRFDPVERTEEWEDCIYDVEKECDELLANERKGMGFCFSYWSTKRAVLARHGIEWCSPSTMNPRVMFD